MKLIVGLGNPGQKYKNNRHNVGHIMIDYINDQVQSSKFKVQNCNSKLKTIKTEVFMNQSGQFVKKIVSNFDIRISDLFIVHDDLDIPLGKFRIDLGRGPKLHNGLESIEEVLGTKDFWRIRIGVDNRPLTGYADGETYVLNNFIPKEKKFFIESVFPKILARLKTDFLL